MCIASFWQSLGGIIHAIGGGRNSLVVVTTLQFGVGGTQASTVKRTFNKDIGQGTWDTPIPKGGNDLVPSDWSFAVGTCVQSRRRKWGGGRPLIRNSTKNVDVENVKMCSVGPYQVQTQQQPPSFSYPLDTFGTSMSLDHSMYW